MNSISCIRPTLFHFSGIALCTSFTQSFFFAQCLLHTILPSEHFWYILLVCKSPLHSCPVPFSSLRFVGASSVSGSFPLCPMPNTYSSNLSNMTAVSNVFGHFSSMSLHILLPSLWLGLYILYDDKYASPFALLHASH